MAESNSTEPMQFERQGYFVRDKDSTPDKPVFNRTIGLRDTFAKEVGGRAEVDSRWDHPMRSATDDIVSGIMAKWAAAFSKLDADALASLYSRNAFFFGSNPKLYRGQDGVTAYFKGLPRWRRRQCQFTDVRDRTGRRRRDQRRRHGDRLSSTRTPSRCRSRSPG